MKQQHFVSTTIRTVLWSICAPIVILFPALCGADSDYADYDYRGTDSGGGEDCGDNKGLSCCPVASADAFDVSTYIDAARSKSRDWRKDLRSYAEDQINENFDEISDTLDSIGALSSTIDLLWPGAGYASIANGGNYEVLAQLQQQGLLTIGNIVGGSGGATGAVLALADPTSTDLFYIIYEAYVRLMEDYFYDAGDDSNIWYALYNAAIEEGSLSAVASRAGLVALCDVSTIFYDFDSACSVAGALHKPRQWNV